MFSSDDEILRLCRRCGHLFPETDISCRRCFGLSNEEVDKLLEMDTVNEKLKESEKINHIESLSVDSTLRQLKVAFVVVIGIFMTVYYFVDSSTLHETEVKSMVCGERVVRGPMPKPAVIPPKIRIRICNILTTDGFNVIAREKLVVGLEYGQKILVTKKGGWFQDERFELVKQL